MKTGGQSQNSVSTHLEANASLRHYEPQTPSHRLQFQIICERCSGAVGYGYNYHSYLDISPQLQVGL